VLRRYERGGLLSVDDSVHVFYKHATAKIATQVLLDGPNFCPLLDHPLLEEL
jgi:hypothetical protein